MSVGSKTVKVVFEGREIVKYISPTDYELGDEGEVFDFEEGMAIWKALKDKGSCSLRPVILQ